MHHLGVLEIESGLDHVRCSPADEGRLELIVQRPSPGEREIVEEAYLDVDRGLVGDRWAAWLSAGPADGPAWLNAGPAGVTTRKPARIVAFRRQLALINARFALLVAVEETRRSLSGDQLHVDLDLGVANLSVGTRIRLGEAMIEVSSKAHTGCRKFSARYGADALQVVKSPIGQELRLRGLYTRIVESGVIRRGDVLKVERGG